MMESFILLGVKTDFVVFLQMIMIMVVILGPPAMRDSLTSSPIYFVHLTVLSKHLIHLRFC